MGPTPLEWHCRHGCFSLVSTRFCWKAGRRTAAMYRPPASRCAPSATSRGFGTCRKSLTCVGLVFLQFLLLRRLVFKMLSAGDVLVLGVLRYVGMARFRVSGGHQQR